MKRDILGKSTVIKDLLKMIDKIAASDTNILVTGESGTGKELIARRIHDLGDLKDSPFVPINCGAIPETLIESEMFGHKKGSFTGAISDKPGLFEVANGGTLFLDEVGEIPLAMQVKLLRAIQERAFRRVGGTEDIKVDVRIISATNRNLEEMISSGTFREDLYYRLNVISLRSPPLRDRSGDIEILANEFLKRFVERSKKSITRFEKGVIRALEDYDWPGNVRELENVIERAVTMESGDIIKLTSLPHGVAAKQSSARKTDDSGEANEIRLPGPDFDKGSIDLDSVLGEVEKIYLEAALEHTKGVKKNAAKLLGITFRSIRYRLKKLGVESD